MSIGTVSVNTALKENDIVVVEMGGVEPNPKLDFIRRAIKLAKEEKITSAREAEIAVENAEKRAKQNND